MHHRPVIWESGSHHCPEAGSVPSSIVPSGIAEVGPLMAADEMHQLNNETKGYRDMAGLGNNPVQVLST
jgi:hypothetical protein